MPYTFARVNAVLRLKRGDYSLQGKRARLRLLEKGNKEKLVYLDHEAEQYFDAYLEVANIKRGWRVGVPDAEQKSRSDRRKDQQARHPPHSERALRGRRAAGEHLQSYVPGHGHQGICAKRRPARSRSGHGEPFGPTHNEAL
jgi:hypothetical protein